MSSRSVASSAASITVRPDRVSTISLRSAIGLLLPYVGGANGCLTPSRPVIDKFVMCRRESLPNPSYSPPSSSAALRAAMIRAICPAGSFNSRASFPAGACNRPTILPLSSSSDGKVARFEISLVRAPARRASQYESRTPRSLLHSRRGSSPEPPAHRTTSRSMSCP